MPGDRAPITTGSAERVLASGGRGRLPSLAEELHRAGCPYPALLEACAADVVDPVRTTWALELLSGAEPGALFRTWLGSTRWPARARHRLTVELAANGGAVAFVAAVDRALRATGMGTAEIGGQTYVDGCASLLLVDVVVRGDFAEGRAVVKKALGEAGARPDTRLVWRSPGIEEERLGAAL